MTNKLVIDGWMLTNNDSWTCQLYEFNIFAVLWLLLFRGIVQMTIPRPWRHSFRSVAHHLLPWRMPPRGVVYSETVDQKTRLATTPKPSTVGWDHRGTSYHVVEITNLWRWIVNPFARMVANNSCTMAVKDLSILVDKQLNPPLPLSEECVHPESQDVVGRQPFDVPGHGHCPCFRVIHWIDSWVHRKMTIKTTKTPWMMVNQPFQPFSWWVCWCANPMINTRVIEMWRNRFARWDCEHES